MKTSSIQLWRKTGSQPLGKFRIFDLRSDTKISPRTGKEHDFFVIECGHWVNVVATTPDQQLILVEQQRHGSNTIELEIPGGMIDPLDVSPVAAGLRELREETGYEGEPAQVIGEVFPNPAIMNNTCYTVLVENCNLRHPTQWDLGEDMVTRLVPVASIPELVASGKIKHSLVVVALFYYQLLKNKKSV